MASFVATELSKGWELFYPAGDNSSEEWLPVANLPTVVHMDLLANKKIPDHFLDMNELESHWVAEKAWTYRCQFPTPAQSATTKTVLSFKGLDTFATVKLNGKIILESDNMFIEYRVDITADLASESVNTLEITFASALLRAREIRKAHPEHNYIAHQGELERIGVRKADYHWGWDWGPKLVTAGPWRPVCLETFENRIEDVWVDYVLGEDLEKALGTISARLEACQGSQVLLVLRNPDGRVVFESVRTVQDDHLVHAEFVLNEPSLWYPHGYGAQKRYQLESTILSYGKATHHVTKQIGFRKAELIQEPDSIGKSFYFRVNGTDIFSGGSCWIPADNFVPRIGGKYRKWLELMVEGNQIMTRIWGGGIYEEDKFYDACDELGILVWQDFLFACGSYPTFPTLLKSIETEARCNLRRLRHHPSLVMLAGGNENYYIQEKYGLVYNYEEDKDPESWLKSTFPSRYIYEHLLLNVVAEESPSIPYHPDSPWGDGKNILDVTVGDIHQWEVWHGIMRPYQTYGDIGGRFNSEFGMESFPHLSTINSSITKPSERFSQSLTMDFHNKANGHERRIASYVMENFRGSPSNFEYWVYLTQLLQSEAMLYAYRSWRKQWNKPSERQCGGALVWQFNDCWPTTSWAIVDYFLVKKPSFYTIQRALTPLAIGVQRTIDDWTLGHTSPSKTSKYDVWVASSKISPVEKALVELRFISVQTGIDALPSQTHDVDVAANSTTVVVEGIELSNPPYHEAYVIFARLVIDGKVISQDVDWPQPYKYLSFEEDRGLQVKLAACRKQIEITADRPTKGVIFDERPGLKFSNNVIDVMPREVYVVGIEGLDAGELLHWTYLGIDENVSSTGILKSEI